MPPRYRAALALTLAVAASLPAAAKKPSHPRAHHRRAEPAATMPAEDLYSRRALKRARTILELKLMELRAEHLERLRKALEKHLPIDQLLKE